jgi:hypothetical protein
MYLINGRPIPQDAPFTDANGTQYPANWIRLASDAEKAAIGIEWIADPEPFNDRFYWSASHAKDLDQCKSMLITQVKQNAAASSQASGTQQAATGQGGGSTMLTEGMGIDPSSLALGRKSLLGG